MSMSNAEFAEYAGTQDQDDNEEFFDYAGTGHEEDGDMVVAYYMPHNDGVESGILDGPGQDTGLDLVDLYEVDGVIRTFATRDEAEDWLAHKKMGGGHVD